MPLVRSFRLALVLALVCLSGVCCRPSVVPAPDTRTIADRVLAESVALMDEDSAKPDCGGVWVARDLIVTALHCVADNGKPALSIDMMLRALEAAIEGGDDAVVTEGVWNPTGQAAHYSVPGAPSFALPGIILKVDVANDLALIRAYGPLMPKHDVAAFASDLRVGEDLEIVGSSLGFPFSYSVGVLSAERDGALTDSHFRTVQVAGEIFPGNSGGGIFDSSGGLVGITDFMFKGAWGMGFGIHVDVVRGFVLRAIAPTVGPRTTDGSLAPTDGSLAPTDGPRTTDGPPQIVAHGPLAPQNLNFAHGHKAAKEKEGEVGPHRLFPYM